MTSILRQAGVAAGRFARYLSGAASTMPKLQHEVNTPFETATFGMGCFWASDALYGGTQGVLRTKVGYSGGTKKNPTYKDLGDHTEVIEIHYDPKTVSFGDLLELFWQNHEYGLTSKIKRQYMSLILHHSDEQKSVAHDSMDKKAKKLNATLITEIVPAGTFYPAEDYHQKYRLQQHHKLCKWINITPKLLQTSHIAARLNGYLAGLGTEELITKELTELGLTGEMIDYVLKEWKKNAGGSLYC